MTFATNPRGLATRRGFTLIELLVVIGIIVLLIAILLPAVSRAYASAKVARTKADLLTIATALDAYKADYLSYPVVTTQSSGAAVLGTALIGAYDAAHYFTYVAGVHTANDTLQNPPAAYSASQVYQAGDVVVQGTGPTFPVWVAGGQTTLFVCTKNDNQLGGTANAPSATSNWWALFSPYDGQDGPGGKNRLGSAADSNGAPHVASGKTYGPYLNPENFHLNGVDILDAYGSPILYFPVNRQADTQLKAGVTTGGFVQNFGYTASGARPMIDASDNLNAFYNETITPTQNATAMLAKIRIMLGDYNQDGYHDSTEPALPDTPYLLWTAGPDKKFGPRGNVDPASGTKYDVFTSSTHTNDNILSAAACDDVTNFR